MTVAEEPGSGVVDWALRALGRDARLVAVSSLGQTGAGSPWRIDVERGGTADAVVVKVGDPADDRERARFATEAAALGLAEQHDVAAPRPLAADLDGADAGALALLTTLLAGSSRIAQDTDPQRLRALGAAAAAIHAIPAAASDVLPLRVRSLEGVFDEDEIEGPSAALFERAAARLGEGQPPEGEPHGLVHGDLWHGNTMWDGADYVGALDWDFAGVGPAGIDLGSLRCDAALQYGVDAADHVLAGWEERHGGPAPNLAWWDVVAGLATPCDPRHWLPAFHGQGRTDVTAELLRTRRDAYLARALDALG